MKINNAKITFLVSAGGAAIELKDADANVAFARVTLTPEQLCAALSRIAYTECEIEVFNLDKVGKTYENKSFEFEIEEGLSGSKNAEALHFIALDTLQKQDMKDWTPDRYYSSQNSFFQKDGKHYARTTIRRWI